MNILITGAASGIGRATAEYFIKRGHTVFGIDIVPVSDCGQMRSFVVDITEENALIAVREVLAEQEIVLDAIVNVAGMHRMASLVESEYAMMKKMVEVNLCGTMLVNRVFHQCLNENGRIVIVTSEVASLDPMPFNGMYNVTKTALDTYAQALRQELNLIGQKVITVRPGSVETPLCHGSVKATAELAEQTVLYVKQAKSFSGLAAKFMGKPIKAEVLAALLYKATVSEHPKLIYQKHRNPGLVLLNMLPKRWQCWIIKLLLKLNLF
jgi:NAD(P)-dependent dehydrogenase (short-subunit alcohol dehydrogenase family)